MWRIRQKQLVTSNGGNAGLLRRTKAYGFNDERRPEPFVDRAQQIKNQNHPCKHHFSTQTSFDLAVPACSPILYRL